MNRRRFRRPPANELPHRRRRRGPLGWALLLSLMLNHILMMPVAYLLLREVQVTEPPVTVELVDEPTRREEQPPNKVDLPKRRPRRVKPEQRLAVQPRERQPEPKPEPKPKPEQKPPEEQEQQPPEAVPRLKMVEVNTPETKEQAKNARFLSDKNRKVDKETRARNTNLVREEPKPQPTSERNRRREPDPGAQKPRVAETEERPAPTPKQQARRQQQRKQAQKQQQRVSPLLSMRPAQPPREAVKPTAEPDDQGNLPREQQAQPAQQQQQRTRQQHAEQQLDLTLDHRDFDRIYGEQAREQREIARLRPSRPAGKFQRKWQRVRAALENFVPEVQPGNQTALGTRAHPFAVFIARMHRRIHKLWGFGFLTDLDAKPDSNAMNDMQLWTMVEVVVAPNGTVEKATIVKPSGVLTFDVAALDTVFSAAPYPAPPRAIRSRDGKVYLHWRFHRNQRQCGTFGVDPYILDKPPQGPIDADLSEVASSGGAAGPRTRRRLNRPMRGRAALEGASGGAGPARAPQNEHVPSARANHARREGQGLAGAGRAGRGHDHAGHSHERSGGHARRQSPVRDGGDAGARPSKEGAARQAAQQRVRSDDPAALAAARRFVGAFRAGDARAMAASCGLPFHSQGRKVATARAELQRMLGDLVRENSSRTVSGLRLMTSMESRRELGRLPGGISDGEPKLVGQVRLGDTPVTLILERKRGSWHVVALDR